MIIDNKNGTYIVKGIFEGQPVQETFDRLYEAEALEKQLNMLKDLK